MGGLVVGSISDEGSYWCITSSSGGMNDICGACVTVNGVPFTGTTAGTGVYGGGLAAASNAAYCDYPAINVSKTDANGNPTSYYLGTNASDSRVRRHSRRHDRCRFDYRQRFLLVHHVFVRRHERHSGESVTINGGSFVRHDRKHRDL